MKPEEVVRPLFLSKRMLEYHYTPDRFDVEYPVQFGSDKSRRADIIIFDKERPTVPHTCIELKKPKAKDG